MIAIENIELPTTIGLTGRVIKDQEIVTSIYGKSDAAFNMQVDNILRLNHLQNIMIIPLIMENSDSIFKSNKEPELVGILHLINYKFGDITNIDYVILV